MGMCRSAVSARIVSCVNMDLTGFFRSVNKEELFNLRHAQARNVIERIFGVLKKRWDILNRAPQYNMEIQAKIPAALAALHNFIMDYDETDLDHYLNEFADLEPTNNGDLGDGGIGAAERARANTKRDQIAMAMWNRYQQYRQDHPEVLSEEFVPENE